MSEPFGSVNFTALMLATSAANAGNALVFDTALGYWVVATSANRTAANARAQAVALTSYGGSVIGKVSYRSSGILPADLAGIGTGSASWVRVSTSGSLERCTPSGSDDIVGYGYADGRVMLAMGFLTATIINGGGSGLTLAGTAGQLQNNNGSSNLGAVAHGSTGSVLRQVGATTQAFGQLDLASSAARTGVLPLANMAAPTGTGLPLVSSGAWVSASLAGGSTGDVATWNGSQWTAQAPSGSGFTAGGDLSGSSSSQTVIRVNGATVPAAGALVTGNAAYVSGVSALTYSALNLAGGSGWVTGVLPLANMTSPTGTGIPHVVSGTMQAATSLIVNADVNAAAAIAVTKLATGTVGQFLGVAAGPTPTWGNTATFYGSTGTNSTVGTFRDQSGAGTTWSASGTNKYVAQGTSGGDLFLGSDSSYTNGSMSGSTSLSGVSALFLTINGGSVSTYNSTTNFLLVALQVSGAVSGYTAGNAPFNFGKATVSMASPVSGSVVLSAAQYTQPFLTYTGATNSTTSAVVPAQASTYNALATGNSINMTHPSGTASIVINATAKWVQWDGAKLENRS